MIYFFCFLLTVAILFGKAKGWQGSICLAIIDIALIFAVLRVAGYV